VGVVAEPSASPMIQPRSGQDTLPAHLEARYGIQVSQLTELDLGVYRVGRRDGPDWVARVFAAGRPVAAAEGDAALLRHLEQQDFPAERCAAQEPVSAHEGQGVLVTRHVEGSRADGSRRTFGHLGGLLGRLHTLPADHVRVAMWANFLRYLPPGGVPLRDVADLVPLVNLPGLERWGYIRTGPGPAGGRPNPPRQDAVVRPTRWGRLAQDICGPLISAGLVPPPEGWRAHPPYARLTQAMVADPAASLPHYPMVSHRGGYPDGS
jgi:hypothetical protein